MTIDTDSERKLFEATTQGEWEGGIASRNDFGLFSRGNGYWKLGSLQIREDATWSAHAHNEFPAWMAEIDKGREAQRMLDEARAGVKAFFNWLDHDKLDDESNQAIAALRRIVGEGEAHER